MKHWRVLQDGRILIIFYSDDEEEGNNDTKHHQQQQQECIHADILPSGILLQCEKNGTLVKYTSHVSDCVVVIMSFDIIVICTLE